MNKDFLLENEKKRLALPLFMLIFFGMYNFWQMGFIYFAGPALTIDGKTPLPISMDNVTTLIAVSYVLSILWMIFIPQTVVWTQRIAAVGSLLSAVGFFLPFSDDILRFLVYVQVFLCCLLIGFESFLMINFFSEESTIKHLTLSYGIALFMIAVLQNEILPVTFPLFRIVLVAVLILLLIFFFRMPATKDALPRYVKKSDGMKAPKRLLLGSYILVFVSALMGVSGPAIAGEVTHGIFITYSVDAVASFILYILYKFIKLHPFRLIPVFTGVGAVGFLLMFAATEVPALAYVSCGLIGLGMLPCQMLPLYGSVMMKTYPSKSITPIIIGLALAAVLVQSSMVEVFRSAPEMLYLVYAVIMVVLVFIYMQTEPLFIFNLRRRLRGEKSEPEAEKAEADVPDPLDVLTPKEKEVAELICLGYTNGDIAKLLFISEHTVKDHTKKIYPKMGVHSRFELATLVSRQRTEK